MTHGEPPSDRVLDLLSDLALEGSLGPEDQRELQGLLAGRAAPQREAVSLEIAAAAVLLTRHERQFAPMPDHLAARILASAQAPQPHAQPAPSPPGRPGEVVPLRPRRDVVRWAGWAAAAACFLLALVAFWRSRTLEAQRLTPAEARAALVSAEKDVVTLPWKSTEDPDAKGASGDVVWSGAKQQGYMRIRGLAANDPAKSQYQLWIFDEARDERYPVDGGVFDVDPKTGEVVVPIRKQLHVKKPTLFAVTVERPGGVTVSARERIVLVAKPG
jgi:anti-sigma-K factor RskA